MSDPIRRLAIISLPEFHRIQFDPDEILTPNYLREHRGINVCRLLEGKPFVDEVLGYAIVPSDLIDSATKLIRLGFGYYFHMPSLTKNWRATIEREPFLPRTKPTLEPQPWYIERTRGWPDQRGCGVCVAVFDSGITPKLDRLQRIGDDSDFCSCVGEKLPTADLDYHGTLCAGAIAAKDEGGNRVSPAPNCRLIAVRVQRADNYNQITLVDILLMLSWSIHEWNAQIINMSFSLKREQTEDAEALDILSRVVLKLRRDNRALVFAAAAERASALCYPASADGFVAVGTYDRNANETRVLLVDETPWRSKEDLLFGPCDSVTTLANDGTAEVFGSASAACAYVAGIAALYVQSYWSKEPVAGRLDMQGVLDLMKRRAHSNHATRLETPEQQWAIADLHPAPPSLLR